MRATLHTPTMPSPEALVGRLRSLSIDEIEMVAANVEAAMGSSATWLEWRHALATVDATLRRARLVREAGGLAHDAAAAVQAAVADRLGLPDARVTVVARAARDLAAALLVASRAPHAVAVLSAPFAPVLTAARGHAA